MPLQGCGSFCFQRCRGGRGSSSTLLSKPQMTGSMGGRGGSGGVRDPLVSSSHFFQTGVDHWECTSPELLMCALSARNPAGNVAVLGYFTKTSGIHKLLKSAHGLKQKRSNSIFQIAFLYIYVNFSLCMAISDFFLYKLKSWTNVFDTKSHWLIIQFIYLQFNFPIL